MNTLQHESLVYDIIKDYLGSKKPVDSDKLIPVISSIISKRSINLNSIGIKKIIKSLLEKHLIVEGSALTKKEILENKKRKKIYDFICNNPSVYIYKIIRELKLSNHIVVWHVNALLDFNFINKTTIFNHEVYYQSNMKRKQVLKAFFLRNKKCRRILDYIKNDGEGCTKTIISKDLKMHPNTVKKYINELESLDIIYRKRESNRSNFYLNDKENI